MQWFRWYNGTVNDAKFASIAKKLGVHKAIVLATWAGIMESANQNDPRGAFSVKSDELSVQVDADVDVVEKILAEFRNKGMVKRNTIAKFQVRNPKSDSSAERVQKHREKRNGAKPLRNVTETPVTRLDESREDESREEEIHPSTNEQTSRARAPEEIPAEEVDRVMLAANDGLRTALGDRFNPIPLGHGSRQDVIDWLAAGIPPDIAATAVRETAERYKPNGTHRQINTMKYFTDAVNEAYERDRTSNSTAAPSRPKRGRAAGKVARKGKSKFAHLEEE